MVRSLIGPRLALDGLAGRIRADFDTPAATGQSSWELPLFLLLAGALFGVRLLIAVSPRRSDHPGSSLGSKAARQ